MVDVRGDVLRPPHGTTPAAVSDKGSEVFLLVSSQYDSYDPEELKTGDECEFVWAKHKVQGS